MADGDMKNAIIAEKIRREQSRRKKPPTFWENVKAKLPENVQVATEQVEAGLRGAGKQLPLVGAIGGDILGKRITGGSKMGAALGATLGAGGGELAKQEMEKAPLRTTARLAGPMAGAVVPGGAGLASVTAPQITPTSSEVGQAAGTGLGYGAFTLGAEAVGAGLAGIWRSPAGNLAKKIVPKTVKKIGGAINTFKPEMQGWFKTKFNVPEPIMKFMQKEGVQNIRARATKLGESANVFYDRVKEPLLKKVEVAKSTYDKAWKGGAKTYNMDPVKKKLQTILKKYDFITATGNPTKKALGEAQKDTAIQKLYHIYDEMLERTGKKWIQQATGKGTRYPKKIDYIRFSKENAELLRKNIQDLRGNHPTDKLVGEVADAFYDTLERGGMKGIRGAADMYSGAMKTSKQFLNYLDELKSVGEGTFKNIGKASGKALSQLDDLAKAIGDKELVKDLHAFSANQYLKNADTFLTKDASKGIFTILEGALKGVTRAQVELQLTEIVGKKVAKNIVKEVAAGGFWRRVGKLAGGAAGLGVARKMGLLGGRGKSEVVETGGGV